MMWSWYLANDMQFYTIAPVILFIAYWYELMIQHNPRWNFYDNFYVLFFPSGLNIFSSYYF